MRKNPISYSSKKAKAHTLYSLAEKADKELQAALVAQFGKANATKARYLSRKNWNARSKKAGESFKKAVKLLHYATVRLRSGNV